MKKKKILIVHNYYQIAGGEDSVVENERQLLLKNGHEVLLYTRHNSELKQLSFAQKILLPFSTIFSLKTYTDVRKIIKQEHIDIVHVHNTLNLISPSVYYAALSRKIPVFQTVHNFRFICPGALLFREGRVCEECIHHGLKCAVKHACYRDSKLQTLACVITQTIHRWTGIYKHVNFICLTEFNKKKLLTLQSVNPDRVFVKPNFSESIGSVIPNEQRKDQIVFAGRLDKLKGMDILFQAWQKMGKDAPQLIVCGTGPMQEWCSSFLLQNPECRIKMMGYLRNAETKQIMSESKALILPTQLYEGFPMTIVEAFSVGTPVLASDLGNAGSLVIHGKTGFKFNQEKPDSIVHAVKQLAQYSDLVETTWMIYCGEYTAERNYQVINQIYESANR